MGITSNPKTNELIKQLAEVLEGFQEKEAQAANFSNSETLRSVFTAINYMFDRSIAGYLTIQDLSPEQTELKLKEVFKDSREQILEMQKIGKAELFEIRINEDCKNPNCEIHGNRNENGNENLH